MHLKHAAFILFLAGSPLIAQEASPTPTPKGDPEAAKPLPYFEFTGGTLLGFIDAVEKQLGFNLRREASIPSHAWNLEVPRLKIYHAPGEDSWVSILITYNDISRGAGMNWGEWILHRQQISGKTHYAAIIFRPPPMASSELSVKAFHIGALPADEKRLLRETIEEQQMLFQAAHAAKSIEGRLSFDQKADILLARGGPEFIQLVTTLVEAFKERAAERKQVE